jgi:hypothetical protein
MVHRKRTKEQTERAVAQRRIGSKCMPPRRASANVLLRDDVQHGEFVHSPFTPEDGKTIGVKRRANHGWEQQGQQRSSDGAFTEFRDPQKRRRTKELKRDTSKLTHVNVNAMISSNSGENKSNLGSSSSSSSMDDSSDDDVSDDEDPEVVAAALKAAAAKTAAAQNWGSNPALQKVQTEWQNMSF